MARGVWEWRPLVKILQLSSGVYTNLRQTPADNRLKINGVRSDEYFIRFCKEKKSPRVTTLAGIRVVVCVVFNTVSIYIFVFHSRSRHFANRCAPENPTTTATLLHGSLVRHSHRIFFFPQNVSSRTYLRRITTRRPAQYVVFTDNPSYF